MGPLWEEWSEGRLLAQPDCTTTGGTSPKAACLLLCSLPQVMPATETSSQPPHLACWSKLLALAAPGGPPGSAHIDIQTTVTLAEAGACGPGFGAGRGGLLMRQDVCMPVILLQGRQEGQMGFLVSVLAPSGKKA